MKIAYIATSTIPGMAANSVHVMKMCEALKEVHDNIILILPRHKDSSIQENEFSYYGIKKNFQIVRVGFRTPLHGIKPLFFSFLAILKAKQLRADIIYTRSPFAAWLLAKGKTKFIFEYHGIEYSRHFPPDKIFQARNLVKFVVITHALENYYLKKYKIPKEKITVLPDGVNLKEYEFSNSNILKKDALNIAYIGGLYKGRGIDTIIELAKYDTKNNYLIVGGRPDQVSYWNKELIKSNNKQKNIRFLGQIPNASVPNILKEQDILLMPYHEKVSMNGTEDIAQWTSPMKMFEYMASGRVIIASDLPVLREVLQDGRNARLVKTNDIPQWQETINWIDRHREDAKKIADTAREDVKKYTWIKRAQKIVDQIKGELM